MLQLLGISNIALVEDLRVEFDSGLNLLTGETGSGKSIIVDALGLLLGDRFTSDLLRSGVQRGSIEGLFSVARNPDLESLLANAGMELTESASDAPLELIIRRELSATGRNKIFVNNQLATQSLLRELRPFLVDIHGQGEQQTLFNPETHLELLDAFAAAGALGKDVSTYFRQWATLKDELNQLRRDQSERFQLVDILRFQIDELEHAQLAPEEDNRLEEERRRLQNVEKLTQLATETYQLIYEDEQAAISRLQQTVKRLAELSEFDSRFDEYRDGLDAAGAVLEDLAFSLRDFFERLEFSPQRQAEIEDRLAELSRIKRKYGGSIETALEHLARSQDRLGQVERSDERESELQELQLAARAQYLAAAQRLHQERMIAAKKFEQAVEHELSEVAMEAARFRVNIQADLEPSDTALTAKGIDRVEFNFSANVGEEVKPLARVASGGEASRLMLVLKTVANAAEFPRTIVFDEIDSGIGGRVSEAVGSKLKKLSVTNQVLCVTHQPQIARFADTHLRVQKEVSQGRTEVLIEKLDRRAQVEELARMLTGAEITDSARRHARELLKTR